MTEMETDLERHRLEQVAKVEVAKIEADAKIKAARAQHRRFQDVSWEAIVGMLLVFLFLTGVVGGLIYKSVNETNNKTVKVLACESSGGTWTPKIQRVYSPDRGVDQRDEWYEICVRK